MAVNLWVPNAILTSVKSIMPLEQVVKQDDTLSRARLDNIGFLGKFAPGGKFDLCLPVRLGRSSQSDYIGIISPHRHRLYQRGIIFVEEGCHDKQLVIDKASKWWGVIDIEMASGKPRTIESFVQGCQIGYAQMTENSEAPDNRPLLFYQPIKTA